MATQNEPRVLFCGYRRISNVQEYFKRSSLLRGGDLYAANHVYCVREELDSAVGPSEILGKCVAQMKSVEYEVRLELSAHERKIVQAYCTCKAGCRGWCKHGAALALYVNNHQHTSCTDLPCAWQKPSTRPTLDTKKSISELFPSRPIIKPILRPLSPTVVHSQFPDVNCAFRHVINFEESCAIEAPDAVVAVAAKQVDESHSDLVKNIFNNVRQLHHNFGVSTTLPLRLTKCDMLSTLSAKEKCFYQSVRLLLFRLATDYQNDGLATEDGRRGGARANQRQQDETSTARSGTDTEGDQDSDDVSPLESSAERWNSLLASEALDDQLSLIDRACSAATASGALD
ncbi:hypothetical protein HPB49_004946 [Dermacentor silvarum]|uniref:Uncharacterized protein n=1 Tax=Dermacentor silvarum TaxID=543639 RepID=A0ACB8DV92_DERSI|nr:hypothetical protein HPB49_004946 [Dermacentor silvarum]